MSVRVRGGQPKHLPQALEDPGRLSATDMPPSKDSMTDAPSSEGLAPVALREKAPWTALALPRGSAAMT